VKSSQLNPTSPTNLLQKQLTSPKSKKIHQPNPKNQLKLPCDISRGILADISTIFSVKKIHPIPKKRNIEINCRQ
jgi:hypothetical protein